MIFIQYMIAIKINSLNCKISKLESLRYCVVVIYLSWKFKLMMQILWFEAFPFSEFELPVSTKALQI